MKVLFVYPEFLITYWSFKHALVIEGKRSAFPPLGLLTISAMLPQDWERRLIDLNIELLTEKDLEWADLVFISAMIVQKESLYKVIEECRKQGKRVVVGGPYVSASSNDFNDLGVDHIFVGEVEETLPRFVKDLELGKTRRIYCSDNKPDLNSTPVPDFSLAKLDQYGAMSVQYSRGCPFQCEFCDIIEIYGRVPRTKSNEQLIGELEMLYSAGWRGLVFIVDDNFIGNKRNVRKLLPEIIKWSESRNCPFTFITEASINLAEDDQLLQSMQDAGFSRIFLGIETPVEESLKAVGKAQNTRRDLLQAVKKIQSYSMEVMAGFIVGFDNDPSDIFDRQIKFIRESGIPLAMVGLLNALPGTQLWRRLKREGRLLKESKGDNTDCSLNFVPRMEASRLIEGYKQILASIYSPREYYGRSLDCLRQIRKETVDLYNDSFFKKTTVFIRLVLKLGVFDNERKEFWRYFRQVLAEHRNRFAYAMALAAMGYHFRQLTKEFNR